MQFHSPSVEQAVPAAMAVPELVAGGSAAGEARFVVSAGAGEADDETIVTVEVGVEVVVSVVVAAAAGLCKKTPAAVVAGAGSTLAEPLKTAPAKTAVPSRFPIVPALQSLVPAAQPTRRFATSEA
jgi:hypothetical protein